MTLPDFLRINLVSFSLSSGKVWESARAWSERNVKKKALGWIPKGYPLHVSVDGGKILQTITTKQMHLSWRAEGHVIYLTIYFGGVREEERRGLVEWGRRRGRLWGCEAAAPQPLPVVLRGVLELWMCRGLQSCSGQWNMLKLTVPFRAAGVRSWSRTQQSPKWSCGKWCRIYWRCVYLWMTKWDN